MDPGVHAAFTALGAACVADLKALVELAAALQAHLGTGHQVVVDLVFEGTQQRTGTGGRAASSVSAKDSALAAMREGRWDDGACLCVAMSVCVCVCVCAKGC